MTTEKIKEAALALFAARGYEGASMSDIAELVGIRKASIYAHFPSKESLFLAVCEDLLNDYKTRFENMLEEGRGRPAEEVIFCTFAGLLRHSFEDENRAAFWQRFWLFPPPVLKEAIVARLGELYDLVSARLAEVFRTGMTRGAIRKGDAAAMIDTLFCLFDGCLINTICHGPKFLDDRLPGIWETYWTGVCGAPEGGGGQASPDRTAESR